jgi:small subunit ribosomal protein S9
MRRDVVLQPLVTVEVLDTMRVRARVEGGGSAAQAEAVRMAVARALVEMQAAWRVPLKMAGMLSRDPRMVERKKAGFKKARKRKQWVKR